MKKVIAMILVLVMTVVLWACAKESTTTTDPTKSKDPTATTNDERDPSLNSDPDQTPPSETEATEPNTDEPDDTEPTTPTTGETLGGGVIHIAEKDIYFTYPESYMTAQEGMTSMIYADNKSLVGICCDVYTPYVNDDLLGIVTTLSSNFVYNITNYCIGYIGTEVVEITSVDELTIAGYGAIRFSGIVANVEGWDCYIYGYAYAIGDVPVMVAGIVSDQAQAPDMIASMESLTNDIAASVRETP